MKERLSRLLQAKQLSAVRFAEIIGVQSSSISHLLSGRNNPNFDFIVKLLERFPDVNPDWFILGQGEMFRDTTVIPNEKPVIDIINSPNAFTEDQSIEKKIKQIMVLYTDGTFSVYDKL